MLDGIALGSRVTISKRIIRHSIQKLEFKFHIFLVFKVYIINEEIKLIKFLSSE